LHYRIWEVDERPPSIIWRVTVRMVTDRDYLLGTRETIKTISTRVTIWQQYQDSLVLSCFNCYSIDVPFSQVDFTLHKWCPTNINLHRFCSEGKCHYIKATSSARNIATQSAHSEEYCDLERLKSENGSLLTVSAWTDLGIDDSRESSEKLVLASSHSDAA